MIMPEGKRINGAAKQIMCHIYNYFENESNTKPKSGLHNM